MIARIVSGYVFDSSDLKQFIHKLLGDDDPWLIENDGTTSHYSILVQYLKRLPKAERVASVQYMWLKSGDMLVGAITGVAEHHSFRARISENERQRKMRDRFIEKVNAAADASILTPERMTYFSVPDTCLAGPVGECYFEYPTHVTTGGQAEKEDEAAAQAEAEATTSARETSAASATNAPTTQDTDLEAPDLSHLQHVTRQVVQAPACSSVGSRHRMLPRTA
ncbi:hypothetical protein DENSPDRAFT_529788 [Dentipellis sp. KUC8613]|nr:hypothetical protein DENSPDRAFT_529788 [Dentipellis sp. KUC8613]